MALLTAGIVVLIATGVVFWALLPRGGQTHRWTDTEWEPYISVAICAGIALSFTMILSGVLNVLATS
jgi:hypothetical protein